jgi:transcriptional regulator with PAS, ATPase and Fis domain
VLQEKEFERVGGNETLRVDVRIITATNKNLEAMIASGAFRDDLFYRLNVIPIVLPPLRERPEDIPELTAYFIEKNAASNPIRVRGASPELMGLLKAYAWPGNIRELENLIERMVVLSNDTTLEASALPYEIRSRISGAVADVERPLSERSADYEKRLIEQALEQCGGSQVAAARHLKMDRSTLRYKMKKYGLLDH